MIIKIITNEDRSDLDSEIREHDACVPEKIMNPGSVDEAKWEAAKKDVQETYGEIRWPVVSYIYKKSGGSFHKAS